ncbi:MAG: mechanosensitive ion channel, partial [Planctomycetes bacterium]|nr:mechanosensitive ion channel [Planctomycetota bacterium]
EIEEGLKTKILELYRLAQTRIEEAQASAAAQAKFRAEAAAAPDRIQEIREQLQRPPPDPLEGLVPEGATSRDLEQKLAAEQTELAALKTRLSGPSGLEQQLQNLQQSRPAKIREQMAQARQMLEEAEASLKALTATGEETPLVKANRTALEARRASRIAEISMLAEEQLTSNARTEWLAASKDLTARQIAEKEARAKALEEVVNQRRRVEAEKAQREAEKAAREALGKHPVIAELARTNADLSKQRADLAEKINLATPARQGMQARREQIQKDFEDARKKLDAGLIDVLGQILSEYRKELPDASRYRRNSVKRQAEIADVRLKQFAIEEDRRLFGDVATAVAREMQKVDPDLSQSERTEIEAEIRKLAEARLSLLDEIETNYRSYLKALEDQDFEQKLLIDKAAEFAAFLDEQLLWIPSGSAPGLSTIGDLARAMAWLLNPINWKEAVESLLEDVQRRPVPTGLVLIVIIALLALQRRLRAGLDDIAGRVGKILSDRFSFTLRAFFYTVLLAAPLPLAILLAAWRLSDLNAPEFSKAVGAGLRTTAALFFFFHFFALLCRQDGVADMHFRWRDRTLKLLRSHFLWFAPIAITTGSIISATETQTNETFRNSLGRLAFVVAMVALSTLTQRILRLRGGVEEQILADSPQGWIARLKYVWYPLAVGLPLALAILAIAGYYYTALHLQEKLVYSILIVVGALIVHDMVIRWLFVTHRRLAIAKAREERRAAAEAAAKTAEATDEAALVTPQVPEVDLAALTEQSRQLLRTLLGLSVLIALWAVWAPVLPALKVLDEVRLWDAQTVVDGQLSVQQITLSHLALSLVILVFTVVAARNLPGVLEIGILQRLPMETGTRYATTTISRYLLTGVGIAVAFKAIGLGWGQVQWLVAALSLGIGFGLQEIVANFVSGLILLFEQPIRVGDIVTIDNTTGVVSRIRIRATTITDWDRKEFIVPNKEFITGRVLNWTLSNKVNRIVIEVGVAYGSDTTAARELLLKIAEEHPLILDDPPPIASFEGFGDSALNLVLRCYLPDLQNRLMTIHEIHTAVHERFNEAGIEIAFPQQDLHIRSVDVPFRFEPQPPASKDPLDGVGGPPPQVDGR